jgi:hypothetical protein
MSRRKSALIAFPYNATSLGATSLAVVGNAATQSATAVVHNPLLVHLVGMLEESFALRLGPWTSWRKWYFCFELNFASHPIYFKGFLKEIFVGYLISRIKSYKNNLKDFFSYFSPNFPLIQIIWKKSFVFSCGTDKHTPAGFEQTLTLHPVFWCYWCAFGTLQIK